MKYDWRFFSLAIVLLLQLEHGWAIHVYQNNEYEVSDIDKRLDIPHPAVKDSRLHRHHHGHQGHGLKRHHVTTVLDTPTAPNGALLFRRQEVPVPEELTTSQQQHHHHNNHHRHTRGFKHPQKPHAEPDKKNELVFALPIEASTEVRYKKSDIPTSAAYKKSNVAPEEGDRDVSASEKEVARHEIGFADDLESLTDLVRKAERNIEQSRSVIAAGQHPGQKRQEIIHALDEGKAKVEPEDDIEALGRRMDETGNEIKDAKYEQTPITDKHAAAATRYIISKIQEIQDKLFKRTGNKELEDKLNQMAQGEKSKKKESAAITLIQNTTTVAAAPTNSSPIVNNTNIASKDKTQTAERRKIIPEEVVDKILEKFQQLKKEAKHMAVSKSRHSVEHAAPLPAPQIIEKKAEEENPYAQIGKPTKVTKKDNVTETMLENRDKLPESISRLLSAKDTKIGTIQLPIGSFTNAGGAAGSKNGPIPIMFIKSQGRLVPVFDSADNAPVKQPSAAPVPTQPVAPPPPPVEPPKMTVTANARAQLDGTAGVADANPNLLNPTPLEQSKSLEQPLLPHVNKNMRFTMADHLLDKLNSDAGLAQPSSASMPTGYLANFQTVANKESESSRAKQLSMAEALLDRLNVNSGIAQPNLLPGGSPPQANIMANGWQTESNFRSSSIPQEKDTESGRSRDLNTPDLLLDKLNVNSNVAQPNMMPSSLMNMFSTLMQPGRKEMQKYRNNFGIDNQFPAMSNERLGEGRSVSHRNDEDAYSRCSIPSIDCGDTYQTKLRHKGEDKYENPDIPSTEDIIQNVLHSPDFPSVAAKILHNSVIKDDRKQLPIMNRYSDEDMEEHIFRGEREKSRERDREEGREEGREEEREKEREEEREKEREEEEDKDDRESSRYERPHRHKSKARHSLPQIAPASPRSESAEELLKHMMEQLPGASRSMDQLAPSSSSSPNAQMSPSGPITSFFNSGNGALSHLGQADDIISSPPSTQDIANQADALRDRLNVLPLQDPSVRSDMQGLNPGQIQFNMQHNLAPNPIGEPSMIDGPQSVPIGTNGPPPDPPPLKLPPDSFTGGVSSPPISDDLQRQMGITSMETLQVNPTFNAQNPMLDLLSNKGTSRTHITGSTSNASPFPGSMPPPLGANEGFMSPGSMPKMDFPEQEQLSAETPDQLLEYAKQKAFRQQVQSTRFDRLGHDSKDSEPEMMDADTDSHLPILSHLPLNSHKDPTQLLDLIHSPYNNMPDGEVGQSRSNVHRPEMTTTSTMDPRNLPLGNAPFDLPVKAADAPIKTVSSDTSRYEHSPDVLLEQLRKQRDKEMGIGGNYVDPVTFTKYKKARYMEDYAKSRGEIPSAVDPSLADFINNGPEDGTHAPTGQQMEVQSQSIASSDKRNSDYARHQKPKSLSNQVDILPGDIVQYNHGKMSSDPANVIASFFKDNNFYRNDIPRYRNAIPRPANATTNADGSINRASIIRTLPHSHVELRINGKKFSRNENQRRNKLTGTANNQANNPNGETLFSKGPIKLELSHANDRSKIVNIITSAPYNVTDDRKRTNIAKLH